MSTEEINFKKLSKEEILDGVKIHDLTQYVLKILMNSAYGSTALASNPWSTGKQFSASITTLGRFYNRWVAYRVCEFLSTYLGKNYTEDQLYMLPFIVQADTDSNYITLEEVVKKFAPPTNTVDENLQFAQDFFVEKITPIIEKAVEEVSYTINSADPDAMKADQEVMADVFISVLSKRYYLRNQFKEFEGKIKILPQLEGKVKVTGLAVKGKSTPKWAKTHLEKIMLLILDNDNKETSKYIDFIRDEIYHQSINDISLSKGVSKVHFDVFEPHTGKFKRYSEEGNLSTVSGHGAGALWHNKFIHDNGLENQYEYIQPGDRVKFLYLLEDNPLVDYKGISYVDPRFIEEQGFLKYIDYEVTFEKIIIKNIQNIFDAISYNLVDTTQNLEDIWSIL